MRGVLAEGAKFLSISPDLKEEWAEQQKNFPLDFYFFSLIDKNSEDYKNFATRLGLCSRYDIKYALNNSSKP